MKLISKNNFIPVVCITYTLISLSKIIFESIFNWNMDKEQLNYIIIFLISVLAAFILSLHYYLQRFQVWLVITGQYLVLIALIMLFTWIGGHFADLHPDAYKDMFWSFTVPYVIGAFIYYLSFFYEVKKMNGILKNLKNKKQESRQDK